MDTTPTVSSEDKSIVPEQIVTFQLGSEEYGFNILEVREIVRQARITRIPLSPNHIKGVTNLRGEVLPIIDLRAKFGLPATEQTDKSRILVVDQNDHQTGLIVDSVHQVTRLDPEQIETAPESIGTGRGRYLKNVAKLNSGERIVMNVDPQKVCEFQIDQSIFERTGSQENTSVAERNSADEESFLFVVFVLDGIEYCLPVASVQEVIRLRKPRRPSSAPDFLYGLLSLRGSVLPVVDMRTIFGRRSIESQRSSEIVHQRLSYETWTDKIQVSLQKESVPASLIQEGKALYSGCQSLRSSDEALGRAYDQIRVSIQSTLKHTTALVECFNSEDVTLFHEAIRAATAAFDQCAEAIKSGAAADQRILVVKSDDIEIGLLVDQVREVRPVPKSAIGEPPALSKSQSGNLTGVAKIDDGKRMILMMDPNALIPEDEMEQLSSSIKEASEENAKDTNMNQSPNTTHVSSEEIQLVCFRIGDDEFGAPIQSVREIDRVSRITAIPDAPHYVEGISNLRGEVLPIVNLRKRFNLEERPSDEKSRIIVADIEGEKTGLLVDSVSHVLRIPSSVISGPPRETSGSPIIEFVSGIAKADNGKRIIVVVDLIHLLKETDTSSVAI